MIIKPRYTAVAGAVFIVLAIVYGLLSRDYGGVRVMNEPSW